MPDRTDPARPASPATNASGLESSLVLIERAKQGDSEAVNLLLARYLPRLRRWASGRLPPWARDLADTQDLVQETVFQAFRKIEGFEVRGEGALQAYLRQALINRIRAEIRRVGRRPNIGALESYVEPEDAQPSPLELAVGAETVERYEAALGRLRPDDREAIVGRVELGLSNEELAEALGKPTPNAARMAVERALLRLAREMQGSAHRTEDRGPRTEDRGLRTE
jgi:RNA polymerase sigma-70 factor (ECF subfamily)